MDEDSRRSAIGRAAACLMLAIFQILATPSLAATNSVTQESSKYIDAAGALTALSAVLGLIAAAMAVRNEKLKSGNEQLRTKNLSLEKRIETYEGFCRGVSSTRYIETDAFFLGPRYHGKTSIVTSLVHQWKAVQGMRATPTDFQLFCWDSPEEQISEFMDEDFKLNRKMKSKARLNIYDYAGEDRSLESALQKIRKSERYMLIFVISGEPDPPVKSSSYFNTPALSRIKKAIALSSADLLSTAVLITKHDLTSSENILDAEQIPGEIIEKNSVALENIELVFGDIKSFIVSGETGFGLATAWREILKNVVDEQGYPVK